MVVSVVAFQLFVVLSLIITRLISAKHLLIFAWAWTAFTLVAVFAAALMVLQLATIWATYHLLKPSVSGAVASGSTKDAVLPSRTSLETAKPQPPALEIPEPTGDDGDRNVVTEKGSGLHAILERFSDQMRQKLDIRESISTLEIALRRTLLP